MHCSSKGKKVNSCQHLKPSPTLFACHHVHMYLCTVYLTPSPSHQIPNNLWASQAPGGSVVSSCMLPRGSPPCVTSYSHSPRSASAADHGYVGFPNQQNQFGHVSLNNFFGADSLLAPAPNAHHAFETKPEFERRSSSIAVLRMKAKEHAANISWAM